jgi:hypothetical protein
MTAHKKIKPEEAPNHQTQDKLRHLFVESLYNKKKEYINYSPRL